MVCAIAGYGATTEAISDEALRVAAIRAVFSGMQVAIDPGKKVNDSWPAKPQAAELFFPDAFANDNVYKVVGKATNEAESEASDDVADMDGQKSYTTRQVRMRLFRWPQENDSGLLAVLQYVFVGARPAMSCPSIGLLVHLYKEGGNWNVRDRYVLETIHHHSIQTITLVDITGDAVDELLVESNNGGAGVVDSSLQVFDLSHGHFEELLNTFSRMDSRGNEDPVVFTQSLDIRQTLQSRGQQFCVSKTVLFAGDKWVKQPRVVHPCYPRGAGVDPKETMSNSMLAPPH